MDDILFSAPSILETQHMFDIAQLCLRKARAAVTGKLSAAERSYPTSEVRGRSREDPHARRAAAKRSYPTSEVRGSSRECQAETAQERPRGATPCPRSGSEAGRTPCPRGGGQEELPHIRGHGQWPRVPGCDGAGTAERSYPTSEVRGGGLEELPHVQGQGGSQEDLPHARGQGLRLGGAIPPLRSCG